MRYFWPWAKTMMLQHDSFHCDLFAKSRAWPSQRPEGLNNFVGVPVSLNSTLTDECPLRCRPREHPEWKQCWASVRQRPNEPKGKGRYKAKVPSRMNLRETQNDLIELNQNHLHFYLPVWSNLVKIFAVKLKNSLVLTNPSIFSIFNIDSCLLYQVQSYTNKCTYEVRRDQFSEINALVHKYSHVFLCIYLLTSRPIS